MESDLDQVASRGLIYAAKMAEDVRRANDALAELRDRGCGWWLYSVSHRTFEVLVGHAADRGNLVIVFTACPHLCPGRMAQPAA